MRQKKRQINAVTGAIFCAALCCKLTFGFGMYADGGGLVISGLAKIKAVPSFFNVLAASINPHNEIKLNLPFAWINDVCGRGAEIQFRVNRPTPANELPDLKAIPSVRKINTAQINVLCASLIEVQIIPFENRKPENFLAWAKAVGEMFEKDYTVRMAVPALSETPIPGVFLSLATAAQMLKVVDGLNIYLLNSGFKSAADFRSVVKKNFIWANQQSQALNKKIMIFLPGYLPYYGGPELPVHENFGEAVRAVKELAVKEANSLCTGGLSYGISSVQTANQKEDRDLIDIEKWKKNLCEHLAH